jgi:TRAP-type C4-dicarboxylate transport system substrate-binding protein
MDLNHFTWKALRRHIDGKEDTMFKFPGILTTVMLVTPLAAQAETTIVFNNFLGPNNSLYTDIIQPWLSDIEAQTEGRVTFQIPEASLAPPPELLTMVQQGIADGGFIMTGFLEGSNPLLQISMLPAMNASAMAGSIASWRTYETHLSQAETVKGVELLGLLTLAPGSFYSMNDTVFDDISDFKGAKFWALPGHAARSLTALGAVVSPGPAVRMYEVISGGVVDAYCCIDYPGMAAFNVTQFTKSVTELPNNFFSSAFALYLSSEVWDTISAEDQAIIHSLSGEALARRMNISVALNEEYREAFVAAGGKIHQASDELVEDLAKAWSPVYQNWTDTADAAGIDGAAALAYYREQVALIAAGN